MSQGSQREILKRAMIEAFYLCLQKSLADEPTHKSRPKMAIADQIEVKINELYQRFPITLTVKEKTAADQVLTQFHDEQLTTENGSKPEVVIALLLGLLDRYLKKIKKNKNGKFTLVSEINALMIELYDTFDRKGDKYEMLQTGGVMAERFLEV